MDSRIITRRQAVSTIAIGTAGLFLPTASIASPCGDPSPQDTPLMTADEYLEYCILREQEGRSEATWETYALNEDGKLVVTEAFASALDVERAIASSATLSVIGGVLLGYLFSTVVDGIVTAATGNSSAYWFAQAIRKALNRPVPTNLRLSINCFEYAGTPNYPKCLLGG